MAVNQIMDALIGLAQETKPFAPILRGPLSAGPSIRMEAAGSTIDRHMDKREAVRMSVVINAKHSDMAAASGAVLAICQRLTRQKQYPSGATWRITDVWMEDMPRLIDREPDNTWLFAAALTVAFYLQ